MITPSILRKSTSGLARKFESTQQALDYLGKIKVSGDYQFEAVLCRGKAPTQRLSQESQKPRMNTDTHRL
jgi:hypothetical protein